MNIQWQVHINYNVLHIYKDRRSIIISVFRRSNDHTECAGLKTKCKIKGTYQAYKQEKHDCRDLSASPTCNCACQRLVCVFLVSTGTRVT